MTNLITIDTFKTYKGINSQEDDSIISLLIGSVSAFIQNYTSRSFVDYALKNKIEYFNALFGDYYLPKEFPLISVESLETSLDGGVTYTALVENTDYFVDLDTDRIINNTGYLGFTTGTIAHKSGKLTYRGGYNEVPLDIQLAVMDLVEYFRKQEYTPSMALQGASVDNTIVVQLGSHLPPHIKRTLDLYRLF